MKNLLLISVIVLAFLSSAAEAQTNETSQCPTILITPQHKVALPGEAITFSASVKTSDSEKLGYNWTTSDGNIIEGKGTPSIKVETTSDMSGQFLNVTVQINGLPENCKNTASEKAEIEPIADPMVLDEYRNLPLKDEKARLWAIAKQLRNNKNDTAYFIIYLNKKEKLETVKLHTSKIARYLTATCKIPKERFVFLFSESEYHHTIIYLVPADAAAPSIE